MLQGGGTSFSQVSSLAQTSSLQTCKHDKVYIDKYAQLMWQDQAYNEAEDGAYQRNHSAGKAGSWNYAMNYCAGLDYQGYDDWRLPTAAELSYIHYKRGQAFTYHRSEDFWTSSPAIKDKYYVVYPVDAYRYKRNTKRSHYIRCVRCWVPEKKKTLMDVILNGMEQLNQRSENNVAELN